VLGHETPSAGREVRPGDNNERIGHVLVADPTGDRAKTWADELVAGLHIRVDAECDQVAPRQG
jgi:argininosuccinate lyase